MVADVSKLNTVWSKTPNIHVDRSGHVVAQWSAAVPSSSFWMRSAGFAYEQLDGFQTLHHSASLREYEGWQDKLQLAEGEILEITKRDAPSALPKVERKFREFAAMGPQDLPAVMRDSSAPWFVLRQTALEANQALGSTLGVEFAEMQAANRCYLVDCLSTPEAREALFLSNPESLQRIDALVSQFAETEVPPKPDSRSRQRLRLAWNYLQRLCAKNDTSSFFGPIAWGQIDADMSSSIHVRRTGSHWLSSRQTFFEHWVLDRLSCAIAADARLRDVLPLQLSPGCHVRDGVLHFPLDQRRALEPLSLCLLSELGHAGEGHDDLTPTAKTPLHLLTQAQKQGFSFDEARAVVQFYVRKGVLQTCLQVPPGHPKGIFWLKTQLENLALSRLLPNHSPQSGAAAKLASSKWLWLLAQLDAERLRFAGGDLPTRQAALDEMRRLLTDAGIDLSRAQGQMYVGRFPVYEDCSRNLQVRLGGRLARDIQQCMQPVMDLHHWLAGAVAVRLHDRYLRVWQASCTACGATGLDFLKFSNTLCADDHTTEVVTQVRQILTAAWQKLLPNQSQTTEQIQLQPADLAQLLAFLHAAEPRALCFSGFALSGVHSPDFMLAAADEAAINDGDYTLVIGEIHPAVHTVSQPVAQPFCPTAAHIRAEVSKVLAPQMAVMADSPESYQRSHIDWPDVAELMQVLLPGSVGRVSTERCLPSGRARVQCQNGVLCYIDALANFCQPLLTVTPSEVHRACFSLASDLLGYSLLPRIVVNRLVLKRRSWNLSADELLPTGAPAEDLISWTQWRQWGRQHGMPQQVFVKLACEPKPVLVDFGNPMSLDLLASLCKTKQPMRVSEMRPAPHELWLRDARGRYCSEFRTSFVAHRL
jgi:hypothetical protein